MRALKTAWFAGKYFSDSLEDSGLDVIQCGPVDSPLDWDGVVARAGCEPDLLVYGDMSLPPPFVGIERFPCLTTFICVDSHIHSWYPFYAQAFDLCTVSLRDHLPSFGSGRLGADRLLWLPAFARNNDLPRPAEKDFDLLFVGNVDPEVSPVRAAMLAELGKAVPGLEIRQGDYRTLFPRARVVLNIAERGDLNFRVFEALGCESCLATPAIGHGQDDLFTPGRDLFTYPLNDTEALAGLVRDLLAQPERRADAARNGRKKVDAAHRARHRAETFARFVLGFKPRDLVAERLSMAEGIHTGILKLLYLHQAEAMPPGAHKTAYLRAARARA